MIRYQLPRKWNRLRTRFPFLVLFLSTGSIILFIYGIPAKKMLLNTAQIASNEQGKSEKLLTSKQTKAYIRAASVQSGNTTVPSIRTENWPEVTAFMSKRQKAAFFRPWDRIEADSPFWQSVDDDMDVMTYSAHYDDVDKPPIIRVVGVARVPLPYSNVTCRYYGCRHCPVMHIVSGSVAHFRGRNGRKHIGAYVVCPLSLPGDVLPFAISIHKDQQTGSRPFVVHYSNSTHWRQASRVQHLLQQHNINLQEGDLDVLSSLWKQVRHDGSVGFNNEKKPTEDISYYKNYNIGDSNKHDGNKAAILVEETHNKTQPDITTTISNIPHITASEHNRITERGISREDGYRWNVTRCFPALHKNYDQHVMLVEMVAASRALGVDHFVFYVESVSPMVNATLQVLQSLGLAEVLPWNLHVSDVEVFYKGQFSAIQDCLYRQLRSSRYVLTADIDELLVPRSLQSIVTLLDDYFHKRPKCGSFQFLNTFFNLNTPPFPPSSPSPAPLSPLPTKRNNVINSKAATTTITKMNNNKNETVIDNSNISKFSANDKNRTAMNNNNTFKIFARNNTNIFKFSAKETARTTTISIDNTNTSTIYSLAQHYGLSMYLNVHRHIQILPPWVRSKVALDPRRVEVGSVHGVAKHRKGFEPCVMNSRDGLLHHYKHLPIDPSVLVVIEDSVRRLGKRCVHNVVDILQQVDDRRKSLGR